MRPYLIPIMFTAILFIAGCAPSMDPVGNESQDVPNDTRLRDPVGANYADGVLTYWADVRTPTPCHSLAIDERISDGDTTDVTIEVTIRDPDPTEICAQVIDTKTYEGRITLDRIGTVTIITPEGSTQVIP